LSGIYGSHNATSLDEEKTIVHRLNRLAVNDVLYAPLGVILRYYARPKNVSGIVQAALPLF
jgi:peptide/nickel transport system substrate-binding protein